MNIFLLPTHFLAFVLLLSCCLRNHVVDAQSPAASESLDRILEIGINEHGLMFNALNPRTGDIVRKGISDNWGYNYNGSYTIYLLDGVERYRDATRFALSHLKQHYWDFPWEGSSHDGIADSVEGALNLLNREPDVEGVAEWIDANINRMLMLQKPDGVIAGWHGDGNYARTAILWALWKQQGVTVHPWRRDVKLGAVRDGDHLHLVVSCDQPWEGKLVFDSARHQVIMNLPIDYPRINQFPEWFVVDLETHYEVRTFSANKPRAQTTVQASELFSGSKLALKAGQEKQIVVGLKELDR